MSKKSRRSAIISDVAALTGTPNRETPNQCKHRGGQPGNQNALKGGGYTNATIMARKLKRARFKAFMHIMIAHKMLADDGPRTRPRPMRGDQLVLLAERDPELAALIFPILERQYGRRLAEALAGVEPPRADAAT